MGVEREWVWLHEMFYLNFTTLKHVIFDTIESLKEHGGVS